MTESCTVAAMAANNRSWTGADLTRSTATGPVRQWLRTIVAGPERRAMAANCCRWLGAAMAANYTGWTGAVNNASCTTPPLRQWLRTTAAGLVRLLLQAGLVRRWLHASNCSLTGSAMAANLGCWTGAVMAANHQRLGLQTSAELLRMYKFNQKIVVYKGIANN